MRGRELHEGKECWKMVTSGKKKWGGKEKAGGLFLNLYLLQVGG